MTRQPSFGQSPTSDPKAASSASISGSSCPSLQRWSHPQHLPRSTPTLGWSKDSLLLWILRLLAFGMEPCKFKQTLINISPLRSIWRNEHDGSPRLVRVSPPRFYYLRYMTGTMPALYSAILLNEGLAISKCSRGGLHHPPLSADCWLFGGQLLVAVTIRDCCPGLHHWGLSTHLIS